MTQADQDPSLIPEIPTKLEGLTTLLRQAIQDPRSQVSDWETFAENIDGEDIAIDISEFYGGRGSPQCSIVTGHLVGGGNRVEQKISWYQGDSRTDFKASGYVVDLVAPDLGKPRLQASESTPRPRDALHYQEDEVQVSHITEIERVIAKVTASKEAAARAEQMAKEARAFHEHQTRLAHSLAETLGTLLNYDIRRKKLVESLQGPDKDLRAALGALSDKELSDLISAENNRSYAGPPARTDEETLGAIRALLKEAQDLAE